MRIVIGGGGHARVLADILSGSTDLKLIGYADFNPCQAMELPYLGNDSAIEELSRKDLLLVNGIGSVNLPVRRREVYLKFSGKGFRFANVIQHAASVSPAATLMEGAQVIGASVIQAGAVIGQNCLINTSSVIDHDCFIGAHSHIAPGAVLSGNVTIGTGCHVGAGTTIIQGVRIGDHVLIGAGSLVISDIPTGAKAYGTPAAIVG